jgi:DNA-binding transcriptional regulator GbsR (MarR family)
MSIFAPLISKKMTTEERIKRQKELVEHMGKLYDRKGFQTTSGRIMGLLIVMDKEQYTFDEIVEELKISKSSASNALRILEISNLIEYTTVPGDRKRYFRMKKLEHFSLIEDHRNKLRLSRDFIQEALDLKADKNSENSVFLQNLKDMLDFYLEKFDDLKKEFLERKTK